MKQSKFKPSQGRTAHHNQQPPLIDVYIRNNQKQALLIHTKPSANIHLITHAIQTRFKVPPRQQLLFHNGQQIIPHHHNLIQLTHKSIIHLVDQRNINKYIIINLRRLHLPKSQQFKISTQQIIEDFIVRNIEGQDHRELFLVYTGRQLNSKKTFAEQFVEDRSQLFCLHESNDEVKGQSRQKYEKRMQEIEKKHKEDSITFSKDRNHFTNQSDTQRKQQILENIQVSQRHQLKQESQQSLLPNFKKKTTTKQITLGSNNQLQIKPTPPLTQQNSSVILQNQMNKSNISPHNNFFTQGSSISEIMAQDFHNPESSKRQSSVMFQSAYIGLNNQNSIINPNLNVNIIRGVQQLIQNPNEDQEEDELPNISSLQKNSSINFDVRAPELQQERDIIHQQFITQQQNEDYSQSLQASLQKPSKPSKHLKVRIMKKQLEEDISQFELQRVQNHKLSVSADIDAGQILNQNRMQNSNSQNHISLDHDNHEMKYMNYLGLEIEPIQFTPSHHQEQQNSKNISLVVQQQDQQEESQQPKEDTPARRSQDHNQQDKHHQNYDQINVYYIQGSELIPKPTESQVVQIQQKYQCETNGREGSNSNSNFQSSNSSRVKKQNNFQSQTQQTQPHYNHFKDLKRFSRVNKQLYSLQNRDAIQEENNSKQIDLTQQNKGVQQLQNYSYGHNKQHESKAPINRVNEQQQASFQIVQNNFTTNSSLLRHQYDFKTNHIDNYNNQDIKPQSSLLAKQINHASKIDELNNLYSEIHVKNHHLSSSQFQEELPQIQIKDYKVIAKRYSLQEEEDSNLMESISSVQQQYLKKYQQNHYHQEQSGSLPKIIDGQENRAINSEEADKVQQQQNMQEAHGKGNLFQIGSFVFKKSLNTFSPFHFFINKMRQQHSHTQKQPSS